MSSACHHHRHYHSESRSAIALGVRLSPQHLIHRYTGLIDDNDTPNIIIPATGWLVTFSHHRFISAVGKLADAVTKPPVPSRVAHQV
jgi:hypothetical protein